MKRRFKEAQPETISGDRRGNGRYSIRLPMQFGLKGSSQRSSGTVLDISSSGIAFHSAEIIPLFGLVDIWIPWAAAATESTTLRVDGQVVRQNGHMSVIQIADRRFIQAWANRESRIRSRHRVTARFEL